MQQDTRRFVPRVEFLAMPGYPTRAGAREHAGLPRNSGPVDVVSTLARMHVDPATRRMRLIANTGFELLIADKVGVNEPPSAEGLRMLREQTNPEKLYI